MRNRLLDFLLGMGLMGIAVGIGLYFDLRYPTDKLRSIVCVEAKR